MSEQALQARPVTIADARRYARDRLHGLLGPDKLADVQLMTSELVTNAVRHAGLNEEDAVNLEIYVDTDTVHVAVVDGGAIEVVAVEEAAMIQFPSKNVASARYSW